MLAPASAAVFGSWWLTRDKPLPDAALNGSGELVSLVLYADSGQQLRTVALHKIVKPEREWRTQLGAEAFAVTRRQATEFAFQNKYWNNHGVGLYRCIACGTALFRSDAKFDSDSGWPSFSKPAAPDNITLRPDRSMKLERTEVLCRKCDAHLGHLFDDGPAPTYQRYCLNSAALRFVYAH